MAGQAPVRRAQLCLRLASVAAVATLAAACSSPSAPAATSATPSVAPISVTSTLASQSRLTLRVPWEAMPSVPAAQVSEVDFLIDGRLGWIEHQAPYVYGNDGNWLVTSFLAPGEHAFTVRAITTTGQSATSTVHATVAAPPPPPSGLVGTWARTVSAADVKKATSDLPPPSGDWKLTIASVGWETLDPKGVLGTFDVGYQSAATVEMRPTIEQPPFPNPNNGGFCADTDPIFTWTVAIGGGGKTLSLHPAGHDPCGDRAAILEGTWTLVSK